MKSRTAAEWVTFAVASAVVLLVIGLLAAQIPGTDSPAAPDAEVQSITRRGDQYVVPVEVTNGGDATAENVQVAATLEIGGDTFEADQVVDFLAGGESAELEFVFDEDPSSGTLKVRVTGHSVP